jgi:DNA-binding transcriptional regulator YhcF (GntR family)
MESPIPRWLSSDELRKHQGPPVGQITTAVVNAIQREETFTGDRLPPVRKLAEHLGVAVNTVAKAYKRLEDWELVEGRGRAGTVVSTDASQVRDHIRECTAELVRTAQRSGLCVGELHKIVDEVACVHSGQASSMAEEDESNTRSTMLAS